MSTSAILFSIYFGIGLLLIVVAVASPGKEEKMKVFGSLGAGTELDAGLMIFIALLWPIWILSLLLKKEPPAKS